MRVLASPEEFTNPPAEYVCCDELAEQFSGCSSGIHKVCPDWCIRFIDFSTMIMDKMEVKEFILQAVNDAYYVMRFCPFCGNKFPESKRPSD